MQGAGHGALNASLPEAVAALARRLGAQPSTGGSVSLTQRGWMRGEAGGRPMRFTARQSIALERTAFEWRAAAGPFGCIAVTDALEEARPLLAAHLLGLIPIARLSEGDALLKGEVMRYLAELAWAPDAILANPWLEWRVRDDARLCVGHGEGAARGQVELSLDAEGRIGAVFTPDRPRREGGAFVPRPWSGRFFDYRRHAGRWLPFAAEVSWILGGTSFVAWHGEIESWSLVQDQRRRR